MENTLNTRTQSNLNSFEQSLASILDSVPALISYIDKDLHYQFMNKAYEEWFNLNRSTAIGKKLTEVLGEKAVETLTVYVDRVLEGELVNFEASIPYQNGERYINATYTPDLDEQGRVRGFSVLVNDLSKKRDLEKELEKIRRIEARQKSEDLFLRMIDVITDYAIIFLTKEGIIENWNKGAEKIKGYRKDEVIGKHFSMFYVPEDRKKRIPETVLEEAIQKGMALREGWRLRKDGSVFWGSITITALYDSHNNLEGFSKVTRDLTEQKLAEDKMRQYAHRLEQQNKELEQFAYVASHDLQEPLRKIKTFNDRILQTEKLSQQGMDYFNRSLLAANRMQILINDLLAYSRASNDPLNMELIDLNDVIKEIIEVSKELIDDHQINIQLDSFPKLYGVSFQIRQLFDNLISNAIKYRKTGRTPSIRMSSEIVSGKKLTETEADNYKDYCHITISDNGIGFDPQYNEKIFDIFQRLHGISTLPGSGIGLAICKKIVKNHQGFIYANGIPDEGATFDIYLPV